MEATLTAPRPDVATADALVTAEELLRLPHRGQRYELIQGELKQMSPAAPRHGRIAMRLGAMIEQYTRQHGLGIVYAAETGFKLRERPDTVRAADAAFVAKARIPPKGEPEGFWAIAPDLVVEVISPSDAALDIQSKVTDWLAAGCRLVWVVYPDTQSVVEYRSANQIQMLSVEQALDGGEVLPGFACPLSELFN